MAYTNRDEIQNYLAIDISNSINAQITDWITAIDSYIDSYTGHPNGFESKTETHYFDGNGRREIDIGDFTSISSVKIMNPNSSGVEYTLTEGEDSDFITYPYNLTYGYRLILTTNSQIGNWSVGNKRIEIAAVWGAGTAVPKDITLAATMLVSSIIEKGMRGGTISSESLGDYTVSFTNPDKISSSLGVKAILDRYKIRRL